MFIYQQAFIKYQLYGRNRKKKREIRNNYIYWFTYCFLGMLYVMPNLDVLSVVINKKDTVLAGLELSKWAIAKWDQKNPFG